MFFILIYDMTCIRLLTQLLDRLEYVFRCVWTLENKHLNFSEMNIYTVLYDQLVIGTHPMTSKEI
jgi:hypothetical protein